MINTTSFLSKRLFRQTTIFSSAALFTWITSQNINYHPVRGSSMSPALSPSAAESGALDTIFVSRFSLHLSAPRIRACNSDLRRGDVVALRKPCAPEEIAVKRVVGLPGDKIVRTRKQPELNAKLARKYGLGSVPKEVVVPAGRVWVEGDNWRDSFDSNDYGAVPMNLITGRVVGIMLPWSRFGRVPGRDGKLGRRTTVIEGVPPKEDDDGWKEIYDMEVG